MSRTPWLNQTSTHSFVYVICICIYTGTEFVTNLRRWILYCLVCFLLDIGTRTILLYCYTLLVICICWGCHCHIHLCLQRFKGIVFLTQQNSDDKLHDIWLRLKPHIILMLLWLRLDCINSIVSVNVQK